MKTLFFLLTLLTAASASAQYFQQRYNFNYTTPKLRNERLNSGIVTRVNYVNNTPAYYYHAGIGTSYLNAALPAPDNYCDRLRFISLGTQGLTLFGNVGHQYADIAGRWFNASGNSIAEVKDGTGSGGYVAVGAVTNNQLTEANTIPGNSDILFTRLDVLGNVISARRIDLNNCTDVAWCIRRSAIQVNNQPTWLICGESKRGNQYVDCFVARVLVDGTIIWCRRYNFDPGGGQFNSAQCIAKQLCEGPNGYIYVVGTLQDNPAGANGIDGLAFALTPNGAVVWANNYQLFTDDEFQAIRFGANGNLIVGGFTNFAAVAPVTSHMLFTELAAANGAIIIQTILRAASGGNTYTSKCYDIVEAAGPQYYLAGPLTTGNGTFEMMYRVNAAGGGINWYSYNRMLYNVGFGIDNDNISASQGIAYFSSLRDSINAAFSDSHIMKTNYNGQSCKACVINPPSTLPVNIQVYARARRINPTGVYMPLIWASFGYDNSETCNDAVPVCNGAVAAVVSESVKEDKTVDATPAVKVFPNPVNNLLHATFNAMPAGEYQVTITDLQGRMLFIKNKRIAGDKSSENMDIDMTRFSKGVYMLIVKKGEFSTQEKIVKQ